MVYFDLTDDVANTCDPVEEHTGTPLHRILSRLIAKGWIDGKLAVHVHAGVRVAGEAISRDLCWTFERQGLDVDAFFEKDGGGTPSDSCAQRIGIGKNELCVQSSVLVNVGEVTQQVQSFESGWQSLVRLRILDDCPRIPIDRYPVQGTAVWIAFSGLDFIDELLFIRIQRESIPLGRLLSISKDQLPDQMVKGAASMLNDFSGDDGPSHRSVWNWLASNRVPVAITPYFGPEHVGVLVHEGSHLRLEKVVVLLGPPEFGNYPLEGCMPLAGVQHG